jgi:saccharopine dehydrogenase-like NADP-dependent oxidoreductase
LARELGKGEAAVFDREAPEGLAALDPWTVIDAAGPFQMGDHRLARAALAAGAHYIDLADGRAFVADFPGALDAAAKAAGRVAVTGASSTPALSNAVLDAVTAGWMAVDSVNIAISPGAKAPRGRSVTRAILSYVGRPVRVFIDGRWQARPGWGLLRRKAFPGLGRRWAALCETPDLDLAPQRFAPRSDAVFRAGLELGLLHLGLWLMSWLVRLRLVHSLEPLAGPLTAMAGWAAGLGTDRSGMIVEVEGRGPEGRRRVARWSLWAEANAGPTVPTAAAAAVLRQLKDGTLTEPGAVPCVGLVDLDAILAELRGLPIFTRTDVSDPDEAALFPRLLGPRFAGLPPALRGVHGGVGRRVFEGRGRARGSPGLLARLARRVAGLPSPGLYPLTVALEGDAASETWTRTFGRRRFRSRLCDRPGLGRFSEAIGPLRFDLEMEPVRNGVRWRLVGWRVLGVPMPRAWAPRVHAHAWAGPDGYRFNASSAHPMTGLLFAYAGVLNPARGEDL